MKRLLQLALLLLIPVSSWAQNVTFVNADQADGAAASGSIATPGISHTAGNWLIAFVEWELDSGTVTGVTNTAGDTWTQVSGALLRLPSPYVGSIDAWVTTTAGNASDAVTAAFSGSFGSRAIHVLQYSSDDGIPTSYEARGVNQVTNSVITSGAISPSASGNLNVAAACADVPSATWTKDTNYTKRGSDGVHCFTQDRINAPSGSQTAGATLSVSDELGILLLSFVPTPPSGGPTPQVPSGIIQTQGPTQTPGPVQSVGPVQVPH